MNINVELPAEFAQLLDPTGSDVDARVREALVIHLVREGRISSGRGAELLGMPKDAFRELLWQHGVPYSDLTYEELLEDVRAAGPAQIDAPT